MLSALEFEGSLNFKTLKTASTFLCVAPYLGLSIITPSSPSHMDTIVVRMGCVPALLTLSSFCIVPAGLVVALGVVGIIIPVTLGLLWVLLIVVRGLLVCSVLVLLKEVRRLMEHCGGLEVYRNGREIPMELQGFQVYSAGRGMGLRGCTGRMGF